MIFLAWGLWVLCYGQFPVRRGIAKGTSARLVGVVLGLLGLLEWAIPQSYSLVYFIVSIACIGVFYFMLDGEEVQS